MPVFLQDLSSLFIKYSGFLFTKKGKKIHWVIIIIPHNLQSDKAYSSIEDESVRTYFMLNPVFNKKGRTYSCENIKAKDPPSHLYVKIYLLRCENMVIIFFICTYGKDGHFTAMKFQ